MKEYIKKLNSCLPAALPCEGHSAQWDANVECLERLCSEMTGDGSILEIGFNAGHSASIFLENTDRNVVSFDICINHWGDGRHTDCIERAKKYIDLTYPERHSLIVGDSKDTVPKFALDNDDDVVAIFVDGDHSYEMASTDLNNAINIVNRGTMVIMDDVTTIPEKCACGPTKAWGEAVGAGIILEIERCEFEYNRGLAWGYAL